MHCLERSINTATLMRPSVCSLTSKHMSRQLVQCGRGSGLSFSACWVMEWCGSCFSLHKPPPLYSPMDCLPLTPLPDIVMARWIWLFIVYSFRLGLHQQSHPINVVSLQFSYISRFTSISFSLVYLSKPPPLHMPHSAEERF